MTGCDNVRESRLRCDHLKPPLPFFLTFLGGLTQAMGFFSGSLNRNGKAFAYPSSFQNIQDSQTQQSSQGHSLKTAQIDSNAFFTQVFDLFYEREHG